MQGTANMRVAELMDAECGKWNIRLLRELFTVAQVETIARIPLSLVGGEDRIMWHFDKKGVYSVKSGYIMLVMLFESWRHRLHHLLSLLVAALTSGSCGRLA